MTALLPDAAATAGPGQLDEVAGPLVCTRVVDVTHDVRSFVLRPPDGASLRFLPGQHLTVTVPVSGAVSGPVSGSVDPTPLSRCYTISSSPRHAEELTITVKRTGGPVSTWLHEHLRPGGEVVVEGPLGAFSTAHHPATRYLFLSAGSGITPLMSMLRTLHADRSPVDVVFVHHARTPADIVFRDELRVIEQSHPGVRVVVACEDDAPDERWDGVRGRVSLEMLRRAAPDLAEREVLTCGPAPYMQAVRSLLAEAGADPARCHEESFDLAAATPVGPRVGPAAPVTGTTHMVELRRSGRSFACAPGTPLLTAAAAAGITLPSSCQEGVCGTCKTTKLSGRVEMEHQGGIRPREVDRGAILLCCATPCEDVVLDA